MNATAPAWLNLLAWVWIALALASAAAIVLDFLRGRRQPMRIMEVVWPVTALYFGPIGLGLYARFDRAPVPGAAPRKLARWQEIFVSSSHCGAGCTLGDILAENLIFFFGIVLTPLMIGTVYILDFSAAYAFGIAFQYLPIRAMGRQSRLGALWVAVKADTFTLVAFEIGLFGWMALSMLVWFPGLEADSALFWFMMQVGMMIGFATTWPANWWMVRAGGKHTM